MHRRPPRPRRWLAPLALSVTCHLSALLMLGALLDGAPPLVDPRLAQWAVEVRFDDATGGAADLEHPLGDAAAAFGARAETLARDIAADARAVADAARRHVEALRRDARARRAAQARERRARRASDREARRAQRADERAAEGLARMRGFGGPALAEAEGARRRAGSAAVDARRAARAAEPEQAAAAADAAEAAVADIEALEEAAHARFEAEAEAAIRAEHADRVKARDAESRLAARTRRRLVRGGRRTGSIDPVSAGQGFRRWGAGDGPGGEPGGPDRPWVQRLGPHDIAINIPRGCRAELTKLVDGALITRVQLYVEAGPPLGPDLAHRRFVGRWQGQNTYRHAALTVRGEPDRRLLRLRVPTAECRLARLDRIRDRSAWVVGCEDIPDRPLPDFNEPRVVIAFDRACRR